jgi:hypothetical protein
LDKYQKCSNDTADSDFLKETIEFGLRATTMRISEFSQPELLELLERVLFVFMQDNPEVTNHADAICQLIVPFLWVYLECEVDLQEYLYHQTQRQGESRFSQSQTQTLQNAVENSGQRESDKQGQTNKENEQSVSPVAGPPSTVIENTTESQNSSVLISSSFSKPKKDYLSETLKTVEVNVYYALECFIRGGFAEHLEISPQLFCTTLEELVQQVDGELSSHLKKHKISFSNFAMGWTSNLLIREFRKVSLVVQIWDRLLAFFGTERYAVTKFYLCLLCSLVCHFSSQLRNLQDRKTIYHFFIHLPLSAFSYSTVEKILDSTIHLIENKSLLDSLLKDLTLQSEEHKVKSSKTQPKRKSTAHRIVSINDDEFVENVNKNHHQIDKGGNNNVNSSHELDSETSIRYDSADSEKDSTCDCDIVECPICHELFEMRFINSHLDECLTLKELSLIK